jgi:hypothetical protein
MDRQDWEEKLAKKGRKVVKAYEDYIKTSKCEVDGVTLEQKKWLVINKIKGIHAEIRRVMDNANYN